MPDAPESVKDGNSKEANEKLPKKNQNTKWYIVGGLAVVAALVFIFVNRSNSSSQAANTGTAATGYGATASSNLLASILPYLGSGSSYNGFGVTGPMGPTGPTGKTGPVGPTGKTGAKGKTAATGQRLQEWTSPSNHPGTLSQIASRLDTTVNELLADNPASTAAGRWLRTSYTKNQNIGPPKGLKFNYRQVP